MLKANRMLKANKKKFKLNYFKQIINLFLIIFITVQNKKINLNNKSKKD